MLRCVQVIRCVYVLVQDEECFEKTELFEPELYIKIPEGFEEIEPGLMLILF